MRQSLLWCGAALLGAGIWMAGTGIAQDAGAKKEDPPKGGAGVAGAPAPDPAMEAWMKAATPGENHKLLAQMAGKWDESSKLTMAPGSPSTEGKGSAEFKAILGGRFIQHEHRSDLGGQPFEGLGLLGFDNLKQKFISVWLDNMGTLLMQGEGTYDAATRTITERGEYADPLTGGKTQKKFRNVWKFIGEKEMGFEMWETGEDGKETLALELAYKKSA